MLSSLSGKDDLGFQVSAFFSPLTPDSCTGKLGWGRGISYLEISAGCTSGVAKCLNLFVMGLQSTRLKSQSAKT